jgi:hypothetical protein
MRGRPQVSSLHGVVTCLAILRLCSSPVNHRLATFYNPLVEGSVSYSLIVSGLKYKELNCSPSCPGPPMDRVVSSFNEGSCPSWGACALVATIRLIHCH